MHCGCFGERVRSWMVGELDVADLHWLNFGSGQRMKRAVL